MIIEYTVFELAYKLKNPQYINCCNVHLLLGLDYIIDSLVNGQ